MSIVSFIEARIKEDRDAALTALSSELSWQSMSRVVFDGSSRLQNHASGQHIARHSPQRVIAECAAKRLAIKDMFEAMAYADNEGACCHSAKEIRAGKCPLIELGKEPLLKALALAWQDHPDYGSWGARE